MIFLFFFILEFSLDSSDKVLVRNLIDKAFNVKVVSVNSFILPSKKRGVGRLSGYKSLYKRVIVTLLCFLVFMVFLFYFLLLFRT